MATNIKPPAGADAAHQELCETMAEVSNLYGLLEDPSPDVHMGLRWAILRLNFLKRQIADAINVEMAQ